MADKFGMPLDRALCIARTEMLGAFRRSTLQGYRQAGLMQYQRLSAQDSRVCAGCIAAEGQLYETEQDFDDHPNCRCSCIPWWPGAHSFPMGEEWFNAQSESTQRAILGNTRFEMLKNKEIKWSQLATRTSNDTWGGMIVGTSITDLRAGGGGLPAALIKAAPGGGGAEALINAAQVMDTLSGARPLNSTAARLNYGPRYDQMTTEQIRELIAYQGGNYRMINAALARGEASQMADVIESLMKPLKQNAKVWRGVRSKDLVKNAKVGDILDSPGFTSTSVNEGFAEDFAGLLKSKADTFRTLDEANSVIMEVRVPEGVRAVYLEGWDKGQTGFLSSRGEEELLLEHGLRLKVIERTTVIRRAKNGDPLSITKLIVVVLPPA
jgi:SPP1 gp7 family putative phage head morphogenesis protein